MSDSNDMSPEEIEELIRGSSVAGPYDSDNDEKAAEIERKRKDKGK